MIISFLKQSFCVQDLALLTFTANKKSQIKEMTGKGGQGKTEKAHTIKRNIRKKEGYKESGLLYGKGLSINI